MKSKRTIVIAAVVLVVGIAGGSALALVQDHMSKQDAVAQASAEKAAEAKAMKAAETKAMQQDQAMKATEQPAASSAPKPDDAMMMER